LLQCGLSGYRKSQDATMHLDYKPAEVMMVDFAGDKISYIDKISGKIVECPVLVCVLPYSGFSYAVALPNASIPQVVKALNQCLGKNEKGGSMKVPDRKKQKIHSL
jgi:hypothetical protein